MVSSLSPVPSLPEPLGPHKIGTTEWEIPISEIGSPSRAPDPQVSTIKFRVFYPTVSTASSKDGVPWLPHPQREWSAAYASFMGASPRWASVLAYFPFLIKYTTLPAVANAPLLPPRPGVRYPVAIFSHGLGGNFNTYSALCASLASAGMIVVAPEHRDGSGPVSLVRSADHVVATIRYRRYPHDPSAEVLKSRNAQLRIRLWELENLFTVLTKLEHGHQFSNYTFPRQAGPRPSFQSALDLQPGHVSWVGHSFGAATIVQFVKSVYYHQSLPPVKDSQLAHDPDWQPLYQPAGNGDLVKQVTPHSPVALLDVWTLPLRGDLTKWLWEKPLPCYDREDTPSAANRRSPNVVAIASSEFFNYAELMTRMRAILCARPAEALATLQRQGANSVPDVTAGAQSPEIFAPPAGLESDDPGSALGHDQSSNQDDETTTTTTTTSSSAASTRTSSPRPQSEVSAASSATSFRPSFSDLPSRLSKTADLNPKLFHVTSSAHLSQSDFGLLFPRIVRYLMKAEKPEEAISLNVRAILAVVRGAGLEIGPYPLGRLEDNAVDPILTDECLEKRLEPISLPC